MNKYTKISDFEINKKVAEKIHGQGGVSRTFEDVIIFKYSGVEKFDPCNNPSDAMPIIIENNIDLLNGENMTPELFGHHSAYTIHDFNTPIAADSLKEDPTVIFNGIPKPCKILHVQGR